MCCVNVEVSCKICMWCHVLFMCVYDLLCLCCVHVRLTCVCVSCVYDGLLLVYGFILCFDVFLCL